MKFDFENQKFVNRTVLVGLVLVVTFPLLFTWQKLSLIDFTSTGNIGDTIGGITAPIVGLLGAFLVYVSFRAQIRANEIQASQANFNTIYSLIKDLEKNFQNLSIKVMRNELKGLDMFEAITRTNQTPMPNNLEVKFVLRELMSNYGYSAHITNIIASSALLKVHKELLTFAINTWFEKDVSIGLHLILESKKYKGSKEKEIEFIRVWVALFNHEPVDDSIK